jgi:rSAM/selenodomain-associated transferase 1
MAMNDSAETLNSTCVVACFVKTPGLSPVKTRLAAEIGTERAERFYGLAIEAIREVLREIAAHGVATPVWAVAEAEAHAHPLWQDRECVPQGAGDLGQRLDRVYRGLRERFDRVVFIGADSPQLTARDIGDSLKALDDHPFALGRCPDGGFYLFAGGEPLPSNVWLETPWSSSNTADEFHAHLTRHGRVARLPMRCDVDVASDLVRLQEELDALADRLPAQTELLEWLREFRRGAVPG